MKHIRSQVVSALVWTLTFHGVQGGALAVTPVQKVISLLENLDKKLDADAKSEADMYDKYACFCKDQLAEKMHAIEKSEGIIAELSAKITALESQINQMNVGIQKLEKTVTDLNKHISDAQKERDGKRSNFEAERKQMTESIAAAEAAIATIRDAKDSLVGHVEREALLQHLAIASSASSAGAGLRKLLLEEDPSQYTFKSNEVLQLLKTLRQDFLSRLSTLESDERNDREVHEMEMEGKEREKAVAEKQIEEEGALLASKTDEKETLEEESGKEKAAKVADQQFRDNVLKADCQEKARLWDQRSEMRANEKQAITSAINALKTGVVPTYAATDRVVGLQAHKFGSRSRARRAPSFLQLRGSRNDASQMRSTAAFADALSNDAKVKNLPALALAAAKVRGVDNFVKVRELIEDLITSLEAQAKQELSMKAKCDKAMAKAIKVRDTAQSEKEETMESLNGKSAKKGMVEKELEDSRQEVADNEKALAEATRLRGDESKAHEATKSSAEEGRNAVQEAITFLTQFYKGQTLLQVHKGSLFAPRWKAENSDRDGNTVGDLAPEVFDREYSGATDSADGIIAMLQVIADDYDKTVNTVTDDEEAASTEFDNAKTEMEKEGKALDALIEDRTSEKKNLEVEINDDSKSLKDTTNEHENAMAELKELKKMCVDSEEGHAERVAKRKKEIQGLKDAIKVLDGLA